MLYIDIISNLIEAFLFFMLLRVNVGYEKRYKYVAMFGWLLIAGLTTLYNSDVLNISDVVFYIISTPIELGYAALFFNHRKPIRFIYGLSLLVFSGIANTITVFIMSHIDVSGFAMSLGSNLFRVEGVSIYIFTLTACYITASFIKPKDVLLKPGQILSMILILLINTCILMILLFFTIDNAERIKNLFAIESVCFALVLSTIISIVVFYKTAVSDKEKYDDQLELISLRNEQKRFNQMLGTHEHLRKFKHDNAIHLKAIRGMAQETGSSCDITEYIDNLLKSSSASEFGIYTGNTAVDATISETSFVASQNNIDFVAVCVCPDKLPMPDFEFCALIGNMLDNAVEACMKVEQNRYIRLNIVAIEENLRITVKNSSNGQYRRKGNYFITDKSVPEYHGIGIKRIKEIAGKYGGMCSFVAGQDCFEAICYLPLQGGETA